LRIELQNGRKEQIYYLMADPEHLHGSQPCSSFLWAKSAALSANAFLSASSGMSDEK
jgi:nitrogenase molybdenum-iron protein alpha/beta subunit